jgi:hypothetical protein
MIGVRCCAIWAGSEASGRRRTSAANPSAQAAATSSGSGTSARRCGDGMIETGGRTAARGGDGRRIGRHRRSASGGRIASVGGNASTGNASTGNASVTGNASATGKASVTGRASVTDSDTRVDSLASGRTGEGTTFGATGSGSPTTGGRGRVGTGGRLTRWAATLGPRETRVPLAAAIVSAGGSPAVGESDASVGGAGARGVSDGASAAVGTTAGAGAGEGDCVSATAVGPGTAVGAGRGDGGPAGSGASGSDGTGAGAGAGGAATERGGRKRSGSTYPFGSLVRRTPRCRYAWAHSASPDLPSVPIGSPSATDALRLTPSEPRWTSVTE